MAGIDWNMREMNGNDWKFVKKKIFEVARNEWKWMEVAGNYKVARNGWKWVEIAGNGCKWKELRGKGWKKPKWLNMLGLC